MKAPAQDLGRITLTVMFISGLMLVGFVVLRPFLPAILWATTLVLATWPLMLWVQRHSGNRRWVAVMVMTLALLLLLLVPLWLAISTVVSNIDAVARLAQRLLSMRLPSTPTWLVAIPIVGTAAAGAWETVRQAGVEEFAAKLVPYIGSLAHWFVSAAGSLGLMFVQFLLTSAIAAILYAGGETAGATALRFGRRLAGDRGERAVYLAAQAIRGVALGVVVTALAQSVVGGIGLRAVGFPYAALLTAVMFVLCLIQVGPALVLVPAVIWLYYSGTTGPATVLLLFTLVATTVDQFIRPLLIKRGVDLPLLLILAGVVGGLIAFGVLGIFIGPTVLAVAYRLLEAWMRDTT